jgi:hypothetical protein
MNAVPGGGMCTTVSDRLHNSNSTRFKEEDVSGSEKDNCVVFHFRGLARERLEPGSIRAGQPTANAWKYLSLSGCLKSRV